MKEVGIVSKIISDGIAEIRAATKDECEKCPLAGTCPSHLSGSSGTILAWNRVGAGVGDLVEYEYEEKDILKGIFTVYMVPFFYFVLGIVAGLILEKGFNIHISHLENLLTVLTSFLFLGIGILSVRKKDREFRIPCEITSVLYRNPGFVNINLAGKKH